MDGLCHRIVKAFDDHDFDELQEACSAGCAFDRGDGNSLTRTTVFETLSSFFDRCPDARLSAVRLRGFASRHMLVEGIVEGNLDSEDSRERRSIRFTAGVLLHVDDERRIDRVALHLDTAAALAQISGTGPVVPSRASTEALAERYSQAWRSQDPEGVAACFELDGIQSINGGTPAVGREALARAAASYMAAFPDLEIRLESILASGNRAAFNWTLLGTPVGPDGPGGSVRIGGMEVWDLGANGLIASSRGYYDTQAYARQLAIH